MSKAENAGLRGLLREAQDNWASAPQGWTDRVNLAINSSPGSLPNCLQESDCNWPQCACHPTEQSS